MQNTLAMHLTQRMRLKSKSDLLVDTALVVVGSLFVALMAQVAIYLPFSPIPITGQTFAVLLIGMSYGSRLGSLTLLAYLLEGAAGMPFFAGGLAGPSVLVSPTGGYLLGFTAAAWLVGRIADRSRVNKPLVALIAFITGSIVIYLFGAVWLSTYVGVEQAIRVGVLPFLLGDMIKALLAGSGLPAAWALVDRFSSK